MPPILGKACNLRLAIGRCQNPGRNYQSNPTTTYPNINAGLIRPPYEIGRVSFQKCGSCQRLREKKTRFGGHINYKFPSPLANASFPWAKSIITMASYLEVPGISGYITISITKWGLFIHELGYSWDITITYKWKWFISQLMGISPNCPNYISTDMVWSGHIPSTMATPG